MGGGVDQPTDGMATPSSHRGILWTIVNLEYGNQDIRDESWIGQGGVKPLRVNNEVLSHVWATHIVQ